MKSRDVSKLFYGLLRLHANCAESASQYDSRISDDSSELKHFLAPFAFQTSRIDFPLFLDPIDVKATDDNLNNVECNQ